MAKRKKVDKNRQIVFVLSISARGFDLVRYDNLLHPPKITVAQQAENPKLGQIAVGSSFDDLDKAIVDAVKESQSNQ